MAVRGCKAVLILGCLVLGCARSEPVDRTRAATPASAVTPHVETPTPDGQAGSAAIAAVVPQPVEAKKPMSVIGRWKSDDVCIELFGNGDFQLSLLSLQPKIQILGSATVEQQTDDVKLNLHVKRIWKGRYVSSCRRTHQLGDFITEQEALGVWFRKGQDASLTLAVHGDTAKLCGARCAELHHATPVLSGRYRDTSVENPWRPTRPWKQGDILEIDLAESLSHLWRGGPWKEPQTNPDGTSGDMNIVEIGGTAVARFVKTDTFAIELKTEDGKLEKLTAIRLPDEKLEVCDAKHCATLDRQFDAYHYELD